MSYLCIICDTKYPINNMIELSCSDKFCRNCVRYFVDFTAKNDGVFDCPTCKRPFDPLPYITKKVLYERVKRDMARNSVINTLYNTSHGATCDTCKRCGSKYHIGQCEDIDSLRKIDINTRTCPTCNTRIERNGGCSHIKCIICGTDFDWKTGELFISPLRLKYDNILPSLL